MFIFFLIILPSTLDEQHCHKKAVFFKLKPARHLTPIDTDTPSEALSDIYMKMCLENTTLVRSIGNSLGLYDEFYLTTCVFMIA
jgi:hypothetical protein